VVAPVTSSWPLADKAQVIPVLEVAKVLGVKA